MGLPMRCAGSSPRTRPRSDRPHQLSQYKQTTKSPQQIGRELGVEYLLTGTVRWEKDSRAGTSRVRVSPELIQVTTASTKWQAPFEAPLTDVFQVQGQSRAEWPRRSV